MNTFVRPASASDLADLVECESQYRMAVGAVERGGAELLAESPVAGPSGWGVRLENPEWEVVVGGIDGVVLGLCAGQLNPGTHTARIALLWVHPGAREVGLGEDLLTSFSEAVRASGATRIEAVALPGDRDTKNLFERAGLVARLIVVSSRL